MRQFTRFIWHYLITGCSLTGVAVAGIGHPTIQVQPDGTIVDDGTNCVMVGNDGTATINLIPPQRLQNDYWDTRDENPIRPTREVYEKGFDYTHKGLYLDLASINTAGRTEFDSDYLEVPETRERIVHSPGNEGELICLKVLHKPGRSPYSRVQSWFEIVGYHGAAIAASWGTDKLTGNRLVNFKKPDFFSAIHAYGMLSVQMKAGSDLQQFYMHQGFSPTQATCLAAGTQAASWPVMNYLVAPANKLVIGGRYAHFFLSSLSRNTINCIGSVAFQPLGEYISPANGTIRQPGSLSVTEAWAGPGALALAYATQPLYSAVTSTSYQDAPPVLWTKITVTSSGGTRTFIKNINERYFWRDSDILPYLYDGLIMISMAAEENPSHVTTIYFAEHLKRASAAYTGMALSTNERMQEIEQFFQGEIDNGIVTVGLVAVLQAATVASPLIKAGLKAVTPYVSSIVPYPAALQNAVATVGFAVVRVRAGATMAGHAVRSAAGKAVLAIPGAEQLAALMPVATAAPPVSYSVTKGLGLHFSLHYTGPVSTLFTARISDMMTEASTPRSPGRMLFQPDMRLVIDHYVSK